MICEIFGVFPLDHMHDMHLSLVLPGKARRLDQGAFRAGGKIDAHYDVL